MEYDLRFKHNASMILAGPSQSGKTTFILKLLKHKSWLFDTPLNTVYWFYGLYQPELHSKLREENVLLEEGLPSSFEHIKPYSIIIIDDLMQEVKTSQAVTNLFTRIAHHKHCFVILVTQNLFEKGSRTQHLNAQYLVAFKNPRDALQMRILGMQMFPGRKNFLTAVYQDATSESHGYLLIDSHQDTHDQIRLRSHIFGDETPMRAYQVRA